MGIEPFLIASSLVGVVGQRLVRKICPSCVTPYEPTAEERKLYELLGGTHKDTFVHGAGCNYCSAHRLPRPGRRVRGARRHRRDPPADRDRRRRRRTLRALAVAQGMRTMSHEAMALVAGDVTTIDEVIHNVYVN